MDGFKKLPKVQCFKEGGYVTKKEVKREEKREEKKDIAKDKEIVKKAVRQHETAKHKDEPKTELKLKTGGRAKKEKGTVKKFKEGGCTTDKKEAPKKMAMGGLSNGQKGGAPAPRSRGPIKPLPIAAENRGPSELIRNRPSDLDIIKALQTGQNTLAPAQPMGGAPIGNAPAVMPGARQPNPMPQGMGGMGLAQPSLGMGQAAPVQQMQPGLPAMKRGGGVGHYANGGYAEGGMLERLKNNILGTPEQNAEAMRRLDRIAQQESMVGEMERAARALRGQGAVSDKERETVTKGLNNPKKRGGKVCK